MQRIITFVTMISLFGCGKSSTEKIELSREIPIQPDYRLLIEGNRPETYTSPALPFIKESGLLQSIPAIKITEDDFEEIEELFSKAYKQTSGIRIDFVLMVHNARYDLQSYDDNSRFSQDLVYEILDQNRYEIIGFEGSGLDNFTVEGWRKEYEELNGAKMPEQQFRIYVENDGAAKFLEDFPETPAVGTEVNKFGFAQIYIAVNETLKNQGVFWALCYLRSEIAIARTILAAKEKGVSRCAIVIGASHGRDVIQICHEWKIEANIFQALTEEDKAYEHHILFAE